MADHSAPASSPADLVSLHEAEVVAWLKQHPDLLLRHPDLCDILQPPERRSDDNVVDLQRFMVQRLQGALARASNVGTELLAASQIGTASWWERVGNNVKISAGAG